MSKISGEMTSIKSDREASKTKLQSLESTEVSFLIAKFLAERGVNRVFSLCGGHILPIWDHAARMGIEIIDVRDERCAVHMAHAHSEVTGELGVAMVTAGPGMTNAMTGIANAHTSRVPVLIISGVPPRPQWNRGPLQELPQVEIVKPITRYARTIGYASHILRELDEAVACAKGQGNEPGPAFIDFPTDLLREQLPESLIDKDYFLERKFFYDSPDSEAVSLATEMIWSAKRPLVISGRGVRGAQGPLTRLLDILGCVYLDTAESRGVIPEDHPACMPAARGRAMQEADLVLTLGRRLDFQLGYGSPVVFPNARFVRIGNSAMEIRDNRRGDMELFGHTKNVLENILENAGERLPSTDRAWVDEMRRFDIERREKLSRELTEAEPGSDGAMHPYRMLGCIKNVLRRDAIVIADGGDILSFARVALTGEMYLDPGGFGCLGIGVPFGIAAALALPEKQVVVVTGDGSFGLNAIDLDTAKRHKARAVFVVANNAGWNIERNDQINTYGNRIIGTELPGCDYAAFARSLGLNGVRVEDPTDLPDALKQAFENAPSLLDVIVTRDASSPDSSSGLPVIPEMQPLSSWDKLEKDRMKQ